MWDIDSVIDVNQRPEVKMIVEEQMSWHWNWNLSLFHFEMDNGDIHENICNSSPSTKSYQKKSKLIFLLIYNTLKAHALKEKS